MPEHSPTLRGAVIDTLQGATLVALWGGVGKRIAGKRGRALGSAFGLAIIAGHPVLSRVPGLRVLLYGPSTAVGHGMAAIWHPPADTAAADIYRTE